MKIYVLYLSCLLLLIASEWVTFSAQSKPLGTPEKGVTKGDSSHQAENSATSEKDKDPRHDVTVIVKQENGLGEKRDKQETDENVNIQRRLSFYTGVLAVVGLFTFLVIGWQSWETRKAADAAKLNAQALINTERPWFVVTVEHSMGHPGFYNLKITNKGRTPGILEEIFVEKCFIENPSNLPSPPSYSSGCIGPNDNLFVNGDSYNIPPHFNASLEI
jgi:hypothetical protein